MAIAKVQRDVVHEIIIRLEIVSPVYPGFFYYSFVEKNNYLILAI